jgi:hypothetical protein
MDKFASGRDKQFQNLIDLVEADQAVAAPPGEATRTVAAQSDEWREEEYDDAVLERAAKGLGPCVGDDGPVQTGILCDGQGVSDVRLKGDVQRIGTTVFGLPLYHFKYRGKPETHEGVMAHEVLQVMPDAVSRGEDGYYRVNYAALGTRMRRVS